MTMVMVATTRVAEPGEVNGYVAREATSNAAEIANNPHHNSIEEHMIRTNVRRNLPSAIISGSPNVVINVLLPSVSLLA